MNEMKDSWNEFTATQQVMTHGLGFDWNARIQMAPGLTIFVNDAYSGSRSNEVQHEPCWIRVVGLCAYLTPTRTAICIRSRQLTRVITRPFYPGRNAQYP